MHLAESLQLAGELAWHSAPEKLGWFLVKTWWFSLLDTFATRIEGQILKGARKNAQAQSTSTAQMTLAEDQTQNFCSQLFSESVASPPLVLSEDQFSHLRILSDNLEGRSDIVENYQYLEVAFQDVEQLQMSTGWYDIPNNDTASWR